MQVKAEGGDVYLIADDGTKTLVTPAYINFVLTINAALEDGQIVAAATALAIARAEREQWKALAEKRGQELADLRGGQT